MHENEGAGRNPGTFNITQYKQIINWGGFTKGRSNYLEMKGERDEEGEPPPPMYHDTFIWVQNVD